MNKNPDDSGARTPVVQKTFQTKSATLIGAHMRPGSGSPSRNAGFRWQSCGGPRWSEDLTHPSEAAVVLYCAGSPMYITHSTQETCATAAVGHADDLLFDILTCTASIRQL